MEMTERLEQALDRLKRINHVALATADLAGRPWNSPVFATYNTELTFVWASHPQAQHSRNIAANGRVFMVLYDSVTGEDGGLYLECRAEVVTDESEIKAALHVLGGRRGRVFPVAKFLAQSTTQHIYRARPERAWVNRSMRDSEGDFLQDIRYEVLISELIRRL